MSEVKLEGVKKQYDNNISVVDNFSLIIKDGEFVSFLGPSGCGKTTTLRMISGLEKNTHGKIFLGNDLVSDPENKFFLPAEKRKIGMVFQSYAVWPHMNVFENVAYPLRIQKRPKDEIEERVLAILKIVELSGLEKRMPNQLSGGQQQRVALARGLVMQPKVLLLDEPLSNLDAKLREKMRRDIRDIQTQLKLTVVYVTHDQIEANTMSDRIVIMKSGLILQVGTPQEVKASPANDFVRNFIQ